MAGWTDRAKKLRENRRKNIPGLGSGGDTEVDVGFIPLVIVVLILLAIGAGGATAFIVRSNPTCAAHVVADGTAVAASVGLLRAGDTAVQVPEPQAAGAKVATPAASQPKPAEPVVPSSGIPMCTEDQSKAVRSQLPMDGCYEQPFLQSCSFTKATAKVCRDSTAYMRKLYADATLPAGSSQVFTSLSVGYNPGETSAQDMLYLFSNGAQKRLPSETCLPEVTFANSAPNEAFEVYMWDFGNQAGNYVQSLKSQLPGLKDNQFVHDTTELSGDNNLAKWVETKLTVEKNPVIHFLRVHQPRPDIIMGGKAIWSRVLYLEFQYDSKEAWGSNSLKSVVGALENEGGFACYWQGAGNLWRITGCWQHYYSSQHWSFISCVNTKHAEAAAMYTQMEQTFKDTLAKSDIKY